MWKGREELREVECFTGDLRCHDWWIVLVCAMYTVEVDFREEEVFGDIRQLRQRVPARSSNGLYTHIYLLLVSHT